MEGFQSTSSTGSEGGMSSLSDLLNLGWNNMLTIDRRIKDVLLIIGSTGGGKTTLTQILAGDLARLHAITTIDGDIVVVDDDNRIGQPSTVSVTLVPELVLKRNDLGDNTSSAENDGIGSAFLDCGGFGDTRTPEHDIAVNFFMTQIAKKVSRMKMLFIVNQSAVRMGSRDFPQVVGHGIRFIKNMDRYEDAIGLVVTKVANHNAQGAVRTDEDIIGGIVQFLEKFVETSREELNRPTSGLNPARAAEIQKEIQFVSIFLRRDEAGNYSRIAFARVPEQIGCLSESSRVAQTRRNVTQLYSERLEYAPVHWSDFGFALKAETRGRLADHARTLNQEVANAISTLMNDFGLWYEKRHLEDRDFGRIAGELQRSAEVIGGLVQSLEAVVGGGGPRAPPNNPKDFLARVKPSLGGFGYVTPLKLEKFLRQQQNHFEFFDAANASPVGRSTRDWISPAERLKAKLDGLRDWYEFCRGLNGRVATFDWQSRKPDVAPEGGDVNWLGFMEEFCREPVREDVRRLSGRVGAAQLGLLDRIMRPALAPLEITYEDDGNKVKVMGNFVRLSEFSREMANCRRLEVYAAHTLFIDDNINGEGKEMEVVMMAPNWVVVGGEKVINLNGIDGVPITGPAAADGTHGANSQAPDDIFSIFFGGGSRQMGREESVGENGHPGLAGHPGGPAGSFFGVAYNTEGIGNLKVSSIGGNGGDGQQGGNGGNGGHARNAVGWDAGFSHYGSSSGGWHSQSSQRHPGFPGFRGGNGGDGGVGGEGGKMGRVTFICKEEYDQEQIQLISSEGRCGRPGEGGRGGVGGQPGEGMMKEESQNAGGLFGGSKSRSWDVPSSFLIAASGDNGTAGGSTEGLLVAQPHPYGIVEWASILSMKYHCVIITMGGQEELKEFIAWLETEATIRSFFNLEGLLSEFERISRLPRNIQMGHELISSFITRVQNLKNERFEGMTGEEKKVVACLLTTSYSLLMAAQPPEQQEMGMVVDLKGFLNLVRERMTNSRRTSTSNQITAFWERFQAAFQGKCSETTGFLRDALNPAIRKAETALQRKLTLLEGQYGDLIRSVEADLDGTRGNLETAIQGKEEARRFEVIKSVVDPVVRFLTFFIGLAGSVEEGMLSSGEVHQLISTLTSGSRLFQAHSTESPSPLPYLGEYLAADVFAQPESTNPNIALLKEVVREAETRLSDARDCQALIEGFLMDMAESVVESLEEAMANPGSPGGGVNLPQLNMGNWKIKSVLWEVKLQLEILGRGIKTREFATAVELVQDALTMTIDLHDELLKYKEARQLVEGMELMTFPSLVSIRVESPSLALAMTKMEEALQANLFSREWQTACHFFKQWIFPFAKRHPVEEALAGDLGTDAYLEQMGGLQRQFQNYRTAPFPDFIHKGFSSGQRSSAPFYVWRNEEWSQEIKDLLAGKPVVLKADIRSSPRNMDAIKFQKIEINLKIRDEALGVQERLDAELERFGVKMVHSGIAHYRFKGDSYVMTGRSQTIQYNFEREAQTGSRQGTNDTYKKFARGDYLWSPYGVWTIQLIVGNPVEEGQGQQQRNLFRSLDRFVPYVDLELVGEGLYVDGNGVAVEEDGLDLANYYVRDDAVKEVINI